MRAGLDDDQDTESLESPSSSPLSGWLVLGGWNTTCHIDHTMQMLSHKNLHCLLYCLDGWFLALQHNCHIGNSIKTLSLWNLLLSFEFTLPAASTPTLVILAPLDV